MGEAEYLSVLYRLLKESGQNICRHTYIQTYINAQTNIHEITECVCALPSPRLTTVRVMSSICLHMHTGLCIYTTHSAGDPGQGLRLFRRWLQLRLPRRVRCRSRRRHVRSVLVFAEERAVSGVEVDACMHRRVYDYGYWCWREGAFIVSKMRLDVA